MSLITTHILDTSAGRPAAGVTVSLHRASDTASAGNEPSVIAEGTTDADGRVSDLGPEELPAGEYRLDFAVGEYFADQAVEAFYPQVSVSFTVGSESHYHVPLLLNPYGYSTYRGS